MELHPQTHPGAVLGCSGELEAQSRWVLKLARSSARCTPREGTKHEKPGGRWAAARRRAAAALGGGGQLSRQGAEYPAKQDREQREQPNAAKFTIFRSRRLQLVVNL